MTSLFIAGLLTSLAFVHVNSAPNTKPTEKDMYWGLEKRIEEYELPVFPHSFDAMEPYIDKETMEIHYNAIFKQHTQNLNKVLKKWRSSKDEKHKKSLKLAEGSLIDIWRNVMEIPDEFRKQFMYYGGGYLNHLIYFSTMSPNKNGKEREPSKEFVELAERSFHNVTLMKKDMNDTAGVLFGTGWVYLVRATGYTDGEYLTVMSTLEEMTPLDNKRIFPILALDIWEHAYFRKYKNNRANYVRNWWKLVDWARVERLLNWWKKLVPATVVKPKGKHIDL